MDDIGIDMDAEKARVLEELKAFQDVCLPAFFAPGGIVPVWDDRRPLGEPDVANRPLHRWRRAVDRLAHALVETDFLLDRVDFADFLFEKPEGDYSVHEGQIVWRVGVGMYCNRESNAYAYLDRMGLGSEVVGDPVEFLNSRTPAARSWLLGLGVDQPDLGNTLCFLLPLLAEGDTQVVKEMLDPETWQALVLDKEGIMPEVRVKRLRIIDVHLPRYLNNALLHVFGALANNRFATILDLLDHPCLLGGYTDLFSHYLFGVLFGKVEILRGLGRGA